MAPDTGAGFRSLADVWADTTTPHGRLMLTVLGGLAEYTYPNRGRSSSRQDAWDSHGSTANTYRSSKSTRP